MPISVAVIGGGVAGLSTGIALAKQGLEVSIFERATDYKLSGAQYNIWGNGRRCLDYLGIHPNIGHNITKTVFYKTSNGFEKHLRTLEVHKQAQGPNLTRLEFFPALLEQIRCLENIKLNMEKHLVGIEQNDQKVTLRFADGSTHEADFVVGADGINSSVRKILFPGHDPSPIDLVAIGGCVKLDDQEGVLFSESHTFSIRFDKSFAFVCVSAGGGKVTWITAFTQQYVKTAAPHGDLSLCSAAEWKMFLTSETSGFPPSSIVAKVMAKINWNGAASFLKDQRADGMAVSSEEAGPVLWRIFDVQPSHWRSGRVVLAGMS
jgi:2-polyprenyl-6-methoxyphenol hydroxylase-like FAD-dependent oxidoreductase